MLTFDFASFPTLVTSRLTLRQLRHSDAEAMFPMRSDPETMRFIPRPLAQSPADVVKLIDDINEHVSGNKAINWGITITGLDKVIGTIGYVRMAPHNHRAEIGYMLDPLSQGMGIMKEAAAVVVEYGFKTLHLHSIEAVIDPANHASRSVLQSLGFLKEASFKENEFYEGKFLDTDVYSLLNPEE
jgi:ribosomal-protein-alanine N-acetyltransferase